MASTFTTTKRLAFSGNYGNRVVYVDKLNVSAASAANDKYRLCFVPGGTLVDRVTIKNGDLDTSTTLTSTCGFEYLDGSTLDADAVYAAGTTTMRAAATTTYEIFPPFLVDRDAYLIITTEDAATGLSTAVDVHAKVEGEIIGQK
jgi:hypothetical protein